jgi:hypothetical protein
MVEAIRGDVLTPEMTAKKQIVIVESDRGGISYYHPSHLDFLVDSEIITKNQRQCGMVWWGLREAAFRFMESQNSLYRDCSGCDDEEPTFAEFDGSDADALAMFLILSRKIDHGCIAAIKAACRPLPDNYLPSKMAIIWAFGENALVSAFRELEKQLPIARDEYKKKQENENSSCVEFENV